MSEIVLLNENFAGNSWKIYVSHASKPYLDLISLLLGNFPPLPTQEACTTGAGCPHYRRRLPAAENLVKGPEFINLIRADPLPCSRSQCDSFFWPIILIPYSGSGIKRLLNSRICFALHILFNFLNLWLVLSHGPRLAIKFKGQFPHTCLGL
jgi:hypothetical protein